MHPRIILAIARKDASDIFLNKSSLFVLLTPICLSLLWAGIAVLVGSRTTSILVYNPGQSNVVQAVSDAFPGSQVTQANAASEVTAAFGPNGLHKSSSFAIGLIIPANFDSGLRAGNHQQVNLYINGDDVNRQTATLVQAVIANYARTLANPQSPGNFATALINPPSTTNPRSSVPELLISPS